MRTERNWSPYQMWANGMMHHDNPLAHRGVDEEPSDIEYFGIDPDGPTPLESDNNVGHAHGVGVQRRTKKRNAKNGARMQDL